MSNMGYCYVLQLGVGSGVLALKNELWDVFQDIILHIKRECAIKIRKCKATDIPEIYDKNIWVP